MIKIIKKFEKIIILFLLSLMIISILASAIELGIIIVKQLIAPPFLLLDITEMLKVFGFFLMVLIGLELLETISSYLHDNIIHVEIVFLVALVAISRKVIILDYKEITPEIIFGMSALILALSGGYFLVKRSVEQCEKDKE